MRASLRPLPLALALVAAWGTGIASTASSGSYSLSNASLGAGGARVVSTSFRATTCLSNAPAGRASSGSYTVTVGCAAAFRLADEGEDDDDGTVSVELKEFHVEPGPREPDRGDDDGDS